VWKEYWILSSIKLCMKIKIKIKKKKKKSYPCFIPFGARKSYKIKGKKGICMERSNQEFLSPYKKKKGVSFTFQLCFPSMVKQQ
jgi:hypothetical protein